LATLILVTTLVDNDVHVSTTLRDAKRRFKGFNVPSPNVESVGLEISLQDLALSCRLRFLVSGATVG